MNNSGLNTITFLRTELLSIANKQAVIYNKNTRIIEQSIQKQPLKTP